MNVAHINGVQPSEVQNEYLHIPISVTVSDPGVYELTATLCGMSTGKTLIKLCTRKELYSLSDLIPLNAHISDLKSADDQGPYLLKEFSLTKIQNEISTNVVLKPIPSQSFSVDGHSFDAYLSQSCKSYDSVNLSDFLNTPSKK